MYVFTFLIEKLTEDIEWGPVPSLSSVFFFTNVGLSLSSEIVNQQCVPGRLGGHMKLQYLSHHIFLASNCLSPVFT